MRYHAKNLIAVTIEFPCPIWSWRNTLRKFTRIKAMCINIGTTTECSVLHEISFQSDHKTTTPIARTNKKRRNDQHLIFKSMPCQPLLPWSTQLKEQKQLLMDVIPWNQKKRDALVFPPIFFEQDETELLQWWMAWDKSQAWRKSKEFWNPHKKQNQLKHMSKCIQSKWNWTSCEKTHTQTKKKTIFLTSSKTSIKQNKKNERI